MPDNIKFCTQCGYENNREAKFCKNCGHAFKTVPETKKEPVKAAEKSNVQKTAAASPKKTAPVTKPGVKTVKTDGPRPVTDSKTGSRTEAMSAEIRQRKEAGKQSSKPIKASEKKTAPAEQTGGGKKKPGCFTKIISVALACAILYVSFINPGYISRLFKKGGDPVIHGGNTVNPGENTVYPGGNIISGLMSPEEFEKEFWSSLGISEADREEFLSDPIPVTTENSPGNPELIRVGFTEEEYMSGRAVSKEVSRSEPVAYFPEFGITVDLKSWNLENETDTLTVRKMPVKVCPNTGLTLYAYDYMLASGQSEFVTEVEVTVPIEGDIRAFDGAVHLAPYSGTWEEDYYTLSEDGRSYTAYMTHFSYGAQKSDTNQLETIKQQYSDIDSYYNTDGKSIFCLSPFRRKFRYGTKFGGGLHYVTVSNIPDFEKYIEKEDKYVSAFLKDMVEGTGGVPSGAGYAELADSLGFANDVAGNGQLVLQGLEVLDSTSEVQNALGQATVAAGVMLLLLKMGSQLKNGVGLERSVDENRWGIVGSVLGVTGLVVSAAGMSAAATGLAVAGAVIFAVTTAKSAVDAAEKKEFPLGKGETISEHVVYYYVTDYDSGDENAIQNVFSKVLSTIPPTDGAAHALGYDTKIDFRGNGWAAALDFIMQHYKNDPSALASAVAMLFTEYEKYIDRFWDGLAGQEGDSRKLRENVWRQYCARVLSKPEFELEDPDHDPTLNDITRIKSEYGVTTDSADIMLTLAERGFAYVNFHGGTYDEAWADRGDGLLIQNSPLQYDYLSQIEIYTKEQIDGYKEKAKNELYANINPIIYAIYHKYHSEAIKEARRKLYNETLPWLNTRVAFYMKDTSINDGKQSADKTYDTFVFGGSRTPIFNPCNSNSKWARNYPLELQRLENNPVLLETTLYNYMRFECPTEVTVSSSSNIAPAVKGRADWSSVSLEDIEVEENIEGAGIVNGKAIKVPIVYEGRWKEEEETSPEPAGFNVDITPKSASLYLTSYAGAGVKKDVTGSVSISADGTVKVTIPGFSYSVTDGNETVSRSGSSITLEGFTRHEPEPGQASNYHVLLMKTSGSWSSSRSSVYVNSDGTKSETTSEITMTDIVVSTPAARERELTPEEMGRAILYYFYISVDEDGNITGVDVDLSGTLYSKGNLTGSRTTTGDKEKFILSSTRK